MTPEQRREATQHLHSVEVQAKRMESLAEYQSGRTTEERREATQHLHSEEVQAKRMESLAEYQSGRTAEERREATQHLHSNRRTFEEQVKSLAAYKDIHGNCHVKQTYKDDMALVNWVNSVRKGDTKLNKEQKQELTVMGFAWDIAEINASKRQQMVLEVCLIVILLSFIP